MLRFGLPADSVVVTADVSRVRKLDAAAEGKGGNMGDSPVLSPISSSFESVPLLKLGLNDSGWTAARLACMQRALRILGRDVLWGLE